MHFSVFLTTRSAGPAEDAPVIRAMTEHAVDAERNGFDAVFLPDHHFTGYSPPASDPMMFAAYLAGRLERMRFGFSVQTVPLHHPVRFAERLALLDQLTHGKILVGVGSGTTPEEMIGFGVDFTEASELSRSNLEIVERLWAKQPDDDPVVFDNGRYRGTVVSRIVPVPYTRPRPTMMSVAARPSSVERAARFAQPAFIPTFTPPVLAGLDPVSHVKSHFADYQTALLAAGHPDEVVTHALEWTSVSFQFVHLAETEERAREELDRLVDEYQAAVEREHVANKKAETIGNVRLRDAPDARTEEWKRTWCLWGTPESVTEQLRRYREIGIGNVLGGFMGGPLTPFRAAMTAQAMELFGRDVIPAFRDR
ncbi:LLM class flavin-dependent oxidoreductase [Amycolatopsis acidicola]|uniref:LLM class flavin-dependent oxidoreductase n=1 Tax=Amycolatopsis acidicola TaxID=2596893 RepID=A0A5N0V6Q2_9PSEU|nr:LLM class flavin-dependent oxidoreductase [Amycolatopsis acidicola]KAA9160711.1 LLM class flavin-dependent oxidoreductase [Amycolatopsis acidicola]